MILKLNMEIANRHGQLLIVSLENVMNFPLEFLAGGLENKIFIAIPTCQFLVLLHLFLLFLLYATHLFLNVRNQVLEKSNDSVQTTLELIFDDTLFFKENEKTNPM